MERRCLVCGAAEVRAFVEVPRVPVFCNVAWRTRVEALGAPRGDIRLGLCSRCGYIFNLAFDPRRVEYTEAYENCLHVSQRFRRYARDLAERLVGAYGLHRKEIVEIGCGNGDFLALLCDLGRNRGYGFDPSYAGGPAERRGGPVTIIPEPYSERHGDRAVDFLCCRHTLEHVDDPQAFLGVVRRALGSRKNVPVFFEVPDALAIVRDLAIWDLVYEHRSYFTATSLQRAFGEAGFDVHRTGSAFGGQYLSVEATPAAGAPGAWSADPGQLAELRRQAAEFARRFEKKVRRWRSAIGRLVKAGRRVAVWGAGSKGVTFLNTLGLADLEYVVDLNPRKQGKHVAGTGQRIVPPDFLRDYRPDVVVVMNPIYLGECRQLARQLGVRAQLVGA